MWPFTWRRLHASYITVDDCAWSCTSSPLLKDVHTRLCLHVKHVMCWADSAFPSADEQLSITCNEEAVPGRIRKLQRTSAARCNVRAAAVAAGVLDISGAPPRRRVFELMARFASDDVERERLKYFGSAEGRDDLATYCSRERRSLLQVQIAGCLDDWS
jgi:hypothetical protein